MRYIINPPDRLDASVSLPASKSISNRALVINALAGSGIMPDNLSDCDDTLVMLDALRRMPATIDIGAAGTAMRFLTAYLAAVPGEHVITGTERMCHRPIRALVDALRRLGADITYEGEEGFPPLRINGRKLDGGRLEIPGGISSQYISALLMLGPTLGSGLENERRRILLDAKNICLDIIMYRQIGELLEMQAGIADELLSLYTRRLESGDASALEVNKIKMELMSVATAVARNNASLDAACRALNAMNGGRETVFDADFYPLVEEVLDKEAAVEEYLSADASVAAAESAAAAARKEVSVNRQGWIPKFEIGYRRNTAIREAEHGFLVGGSIPLYSNHRKVAMAKARSVSAGSALTSARLQSESEIRSLLNEMDQTKAAIDAYDEPLMRETLDLLGKAVEGGEISLIDYFVEASSIYTNLSACITLKNSWHKLMAQVYKNRL